MAQLAQYIFSLIMKHTSNEMHVDFVCDTYPDVSIKNAERSRRAKGDGVRTKNASLRSALSKAMEKVLVSWGK